jgi:nicotinamide-nucleotide amidase
MSLEEEVGALLRQKGLTLGVVESASGGLISHRITNVPGSSDYYKGSVTAYSNEVKIKVVGVREATINRYGAVSAEVAEEMAQGGRRLLAADICLADTGIAGPSGATPEKPVGLFYIGLSHKGGTFSRKHNSQGDREQNKQSAAEAALGWLKEYLLSLK